MLFAHLRRSISNAHGDDGVIAVANVLPQTEIKTLWLWGELNHADILP